MLLLAVVAVISACGPSRTEQLPGAERLPGDAPKKARWLVNPYDADLRRAAISEVTDEGLVRVEPYTTLLHELLGDEDPTVRSAAVRALMSEPDVADVDVLIPLLWDEVEYVRWECTAALARVHALRAVPPLTRVVRSDFSEEVRAGAARALGQYREPWVVDILVGALDDSSFMVSRAAERSLETLTGQSLGSDPAAWAAWIKASGDSLFAEARTYRYQPYVRPPKMMDRLTPWQDRDLTPRRPVSDPDDEIRASGG
ncbi:HEAT repeat domain-containing protein [Mucisphaera calidilacus]|uniref:HEAT repeat protein n=1 Tax=Mucisphaera calidilacus TaxID=2527982 RepID=A0A518BVZ5_9BACT|nr:HEAT repeat domain-containing protein [Mucisphaera calidilacus]QDU71131.1 HEAT repeat protein [Mucisphaera calidilacus]